MKTIFCTLMDDNFFPGFRIFFLSLLRHNPDFRYDFYIFDNGLSPPVKKNMMDVYSHLKFFPIEKERYEIPEGKTVQRLAATYYKLEIFNPRFLKEGDRIIFMDMDILVEGSLQGLIDSDLKGKPLGACMQFHSSEDRLIDEINSGVLVLDPSTLKEGLFEDLLERVKKGAFLPDQEIINREFLDSGSLTHIPKTYNVEKRMLHSENHKDVYEEAVCVHYVHTKPWEEKSRKEKNFFDVYKKWWAYEETEQTENPNLSLIPLLFRTTNTLVLDREVFLEDRVYDCIFIKKEFRTSSNYLRKIVNENISDHGYICGYGNPYASGTIGGHLITIMRNKPSLLKDGFYIYLKSRRSVESYYEEVYLRGVSNEVFNDFLKGKTVVLVGPASFMKGRGLGEFIDSFDVVIHTNNMINVLMDDKAARKDYGSRTDVLYVNITYERDMLNVWRAKEWTGLGLKYLCRLMGNVPKKHKVPVPWRKVSPSPLPPPTAFLGTRAIHDLLAFDLKKLHVTGMDSYENVSDIVDGKNEEYVDNYLPELELNRRASRIGGKLSLHDKYRDTEWLLSLEDPRLEIDPLCRKKMEKVVKSGKKS